MCFGDPLQPVALTYVALLSENCETDYIEFWCDEMRLDDVERKVLNLYSAIICVDFLSEIGQTFNKAAPIGFDEKKVKRLNEILEILLAKI
jgi:hypothetical protein